MKKKIFKYSLLIGLSFQTLSFADDTSGTCSFMTDLAQEEGGSYGAAATNSTSTASGQYQTTVAAMQDCGLISSSHLVSGANSKSGYDQYVTWTNNQFGVNSEASYLSNTSAQSYCAEKFASNAYSSLNANTMSYVGKNIPGTNSTVTQSGLVACAYYAGAGNCNNFFSNGSTGSATTDLLIKRMENAGPLDASCVTGKQDGTQYNGATNPITSTNADASGMYCFSNVSQLMNQYGQQQVETWKSVAGTPGIGYSTMGGGNVNEAAGIDPTTGIQSSATQSNFWSRNLQGAQYSAYSCLQNIMGSGIDSFFQLPSLNDITSAIANFVCSQADTLFNDAVQPINSELMKTTNLGNVGGFLPAVGLGNLGGGIQIAQGQGSLLNVNGQSATNSTLSSAIGSTSYGQNLNSALTGATSWYTDQSAYVGNTINSNMATFQQNLYNGFQ